MSDELPDDYELLRRFAADRSDEAAFAAFVERRIGFVYGSALRRTAGNAHLSEDITQNVFLLASQKAPSLARHEHLTGWLHTATSHIARTAMRDARLRREREHEAAAMNEFLNNNRNTGFASTGQEHMREVLDEALDALAPKDREAVLLRFFEGREFSEIGARLKTNEDAARMRVARALDKLRALFARRGVTSTAAALTTLLTAEAATAAPANLATTVTGTILASGGTAAAAMTTTTAGVLAFMSSTKITIIAIAAALIMATFATVEVRREKTDAAELAALKGENAALFKNVTVTQKFVKGYQTSLENLRRQKAAAAEFAANPHDPVAAGNAFLDAHPEIRDMLVDAKSAIIAGTFSRLYKEKNLTPDQIAAFEDYMRQHPDFIARLNRVIPGVGRVTLMAPVTQSSDENAGSEVAKLLGVDFNAKGSPYDRDNPPQFVAIRLYNTDTPLTAEQAERVTRLFRDWTPSAPTSAAQWDSIIKQGSEFLSEPQMAPLREMRAQSEWWFSNQQLLKQAAADEAARQPAASASTNTEKSQ